MPIKRRRKKKLPKAFKVRSRLLGTPKFSQASFRESARFNMGTLSAGLPVNTQTPPKPAPKPPAGEPPPNYRSIPFPHTEAKPPSAPPATAAEDLRERFANLPRRDRSPSIETSTEIDLTDAANFADFQAIENIFELEKNMPSSIPREGAASEWEGTRRTEFPETGEEISEERTTPPQVDFNMKLTTTDWTKLSKDTFEAILKHHGIYEKYSKIGGLGQGQPKGRRAFIKDYSGMVKYKKYSAEKPFEPPKFS